MFAVIKTGGKQYKVRVGETIDVEKLAVDTGTQVQLDQVLLAANDGDVAYGRPRIDGAVVTARVVRQYRGPKLIVFRYKSKSRYRRRTGHRQSLTQLYIQSIEVPGWEAARVEVRWAPAAEETVEIVPTASETTTTALATAAPVVETAPLAETATPVVAAAPVEQSTPVAETVQMPDAQAGSAISAPEEQSATAQGSAAPPGDVLPAANPAAQVADANSAAGETVAGAPEAVVDEPPTGLPGSGASDAGAN